MGARETGTVKFFDKEKAWGFISRDDGTDIYVHITGLEVDAVDLMKGTRVTFREVDGKKGPKAISVRLV